MFPSRNTPLLCRSILLPIGNRIGLFLLGAILLLASPGVRAQPPLDPITFGMTPAIVHDQYPLLDAFREYLAKHLHRPVTFISRDSYRETIDLLKHEKMDFAWVSDYPYVYLNRYHFGKLLAVPVYHGRPYYRAYLIVPASDASTRSLLDLKGKVFAYADPYSNSGYLVPRYQLRQLRENPKQFFRKTFFTWAHKKLVEAVGQSLADGAFVDSFVWDTLAVIDPAIARRTRIVARSPEYGFPPLVARFSLPREEYEAMQRVLLAMHENREGAQLLKQLNLDRFSPPDPKLYSEVEMMMLTMDGE